MKTNKVAKTWHTRQRQTQLQKARILSRGAQVGSIEESLKRHDELLHEWHGVVLEKRSPQLQMYQDFEHTISRLLREFSFNRVLVSNKPERPANSRKQHLHNLASTPTKTTQNGTQVLETMGVPGNLEALPEACPDKSWEDTTKEDVVRVLMITTQGTLPVGWTMPESNVVIRRKPATS